MKTKIFVIVAFALAIQAGNAQATILTLANWDSSTSLDYAAGGTLTPTQIGSAVALTSGSGGKFGEGVNLPAGGTDSTRVLDYSIAGGGFNANQGTVQFWFKPASDSASYTSGRLVDFRDSNNARLLDIYRDGNSFNHYIVATEGGTGGGSSYSMPGDFTSSDWLFFAFQWDASTGVRRLWVGNSATGTTASNAGETTRIPWTPSVGEPTVLHLGNFNGSEQLSRGVFDSFVITDTLVFDSDASSIPIPTAPFAIPEPGTLVLLAMGLLGLLAYAWRKRR